MGTSLIELQAQRAATLSLIESNPTNIALIRKAEWEDDGAGGKRRPADPETEFAPKTRWLQGVRADENFAVVPEGEKVVGRYVMIGRWDDDIEQGDFFFIGKTKYKVIHIAEDRSYQTKASVISIG